MICPKCKTEYENSVKECADCKIPLVVEIPAEHKGEPMEYEELLSTYNQGDIAIIKSVLDSENIIYFIKGENFNLVRPLVQPAILMVSKDQVARAKSLLKNYKLEYRGIIINNKPKD